MSLLNQRIGTGGSGKKAAIDLGCGNGGFLAGLREFASCVVGIDAYGESLAAARAQMPEAVLIQGDLRATPLAAGQFHLIAALDVLEHMEPGSLLQEARRLAADDAWLLLSVPAAPSLWSETDRAAGHRCRYTVKRLSEDLSAHGWKLHHWTHYQALLFPVMWLARRFSHERFSAMERMPPRMVGSILGAVNRAEVSIFARSRLPWGSSLMALAR